MAYNSQNGYHSTAPDQMHLNADAPISWSDLQSPNIASKKREERMQHRVNDQNGYHDSSTTHNHMELQYHAAPSNALNGDVNAFLSHQHQHHAQQVPVDDDDEDHISSPLAVQVPNGMAQPNAFQMEQLVDHEDGDFTPIDDSLQNLKQNAQTTKESHYSSSNGQMAPSHIMTNNGRRDSIPDNESDADIPAQHNQPNADDLSVPLQQMTNSMPNPAMRNHTRIRSELDLSTPSGGGHHSSATVTANMLHRPHHQGHRSQDHDETQRTSFPRRISHKRNRSAPANNSPVPEQNGYLNNDTNPFDVATREPSITPVPEHSMTPNYSNPLQQTNQLNGGTPPVPVVNASSQPQPQPRKHRRNGSAADVLNAPTQEIKDVKSSPLKKRKKDANSKPKKKRATSDMAAVKGTKRTVTRSQRSKSNVKNVKLSKKEERRQKLVERRKKEKIKKRKSQKKLNARSKTLLPTNSKATKATRNSKDKGIKKGLKGAKGKKTTTTRGRATSESRKAKRRKATQMKSSAAKDNAKKKRQKEKVEKERKKKLKTKTTKSSQGKKKGGKSVGFKDSKDTKPKSKKGKGTKLASLPDDDTLPEDEETEEETVNVVEDFVPKRTSKRMSLVLKAKQTMSQARLNMDQADREERQMLRKGSSAKELKYMKNVSRVNVTEVEVSDSIQKALKSLKPALRRKLEFEIRSQLKKEQGDLQKLSRDLEKSHAQMAQQEKSLLMAREEYQKKARNADKLKEELEAEKRKMKEEISKISVLREGVKTQMKQGQAELNQQRLQLQEQRKRLEKTQDKLKTKQRRLSQEFGTMASKLVDVQQDQRAREAALRRENVNIETKKIKIDAQQKMVDEAKENVIKEKQSVIDERMRLEEEAQRQKEEQEELEEMIRKKEEEVMSREENVNIQEGQIAMKQQEIQSQEAKMAQEAQDLEAQIKNAAAEEEKILDQLKKLMSTKKKLRKQKQEIKEKKFELSVKESALSGKDRAIVAKKERLAREQREFGSEMINQETKDAQMIAFLENNLDLAEHTKAQRQAKMAMEVEDLKRKLEQSNKRRDEEVRKVKRDQDAELKKLRKQKDDAIRERDAAKEQAKRAGPAAPAPPMPSVASVPTPSPMPNGVAPAPLPGVPIGVAPAPAPMPIGVAPAPLPGVAPAPAPMPIGVAPAPAPMPVGVAPAPLPGVAPAPAPMPIGIAPAPVPGVAPAPAPIPIGVAPAPLPGVAPAPAPMPIGVAPAPLPGVAPAPAPMPVGIAPAPTPMSIGVAPAPLPGVAPAPAPVPIGVAPAPLPGVAPAPAPVSIGVAPAPLPGIAPAPLPVSVGGGAPAPLPVGVGGGAPAPLPVGVGGGAPAPLPMGVGGGAPAPLPVGVGGGAPAPLPMGVGGGAPAPPPIGFSGAPAPSPVGFGAPAPPPVGFGGGAPAPPPIGFGGAPAPPPVGFGGAPAPLPGAPIGIAPATLPGGLGPLPGARPAAKAKKAVKQARWKPGKKMKGLHWSKIKDKELTKNPDSVWNEIDDHGLDMDFSKFEEQFHKPEKKKKKKKKKKGGDDDKDKKKKKKKKIAFIANLEVQPEGEQKEAPDMAKRSDNIGLGLGREKRSFEEIKRFILTMDENNLTEDHIQKFAGLVPSGQEMKLMKEYVEKKMKDKKDPWTEEDLARFDKPEAFWWTMRDIPAIQNRLMMWNFKMGFEEMVDDQQKRLNVLIDANEQIKDSAKLKVVLKVVLACGNYLNAADKRKGEANGIKLDVLAKLEGTKGIDGGYSLLMFIYEQINSKFSENENLHEDLTLVPKAYKEDVPSLLEEIENILKGVADNAQKMEEMKKEMAEQKSNPSDDAVQDSFVAVMDEWNKEAMEEANNLKQAYDDALKDIGDNAFNFGEKRSKNGQAIIEEKEQDGRPVGNIAFFGIWTGFLVSWGKAREAIRKRLAEQKKQEKLEKKKQALKAKLERRKKKKDLEKANVIKTKEVEKDHHRKRTLIRGVVSRNLKLKTEKLHKESRLGLKSRHHSIVLQNLTYHCRHCGQDIEDKMQASGEYFHKCWDSPKDKTCGNVKLKKLRSLSSQKVFHCPFGHPGKPCLEIKGITENPLLAGIMNIRKENQDSPSIKKGGNDSLSPTDVGSNASYSSMLKMGRADSGGTISHLLTSGHRRGRTSAAGYERAFGHKVTETHFHELAESLQQWRKKEFDPTTAPQMPTIEVAKNKVKARNSGFMELEKRRGGSQRDDFGTGNNVTVKYNNKSKGSSRKKKGTRKMYEKNVRGKGNARFKADEGQQPGAAASEFTNPGANPGASGNASNESWSSTEERLGGDKLSQLKSISTLKAMEPGQHPVGTKRTSGYRISVNNGDDPQKLRKSKPSMFDIMDNPMMGKSRKSQPIAIQRSSSSFNRHRKGSNSAAPGSPRNKHQNIRRRRSTIEHNVHIETFQLNKEQKEKMDNSEFIRKLRKDFEQFGAFKYASHHDTLGIVLLQQRLRQSALEFLENPSRLGPLDENSSDTEESPLNGMGGPDRMQRRVSKGGEQRRFLLTDMQHEVLSSAQFMSQMIQDFLHFGTLNVHEDELVLESFKRSRTVHACQKLERRLGALWTRQEIVQCMNDMKCSPDDIQSQTEMVKFLNSMVQSVSSGGRFRKHRKHGKAAHRWVLIDKDRLYWKENAAAGNQKTRSFNLAKIVAIQEGKHTSALKNAGDVDDACCFSIVSKKHVTLDLSGETEDMVRSWIVYLKAYNRHFKQQMNEATREKQNHPSTRALVDSTRNLLEQSDSQKNVYSQ